MRIPINLYYNCLYACVFLYFVLLLLYVVILIKQGLMEDHKIVDMCQPI